MSSSIVLARLLTPDDFGLVAMTASIVSIAKIFRDLGLSTATIQKKTIAHEQVNVLFWINMITGVILALLLVLIAPIIAAFFSEPRVERITIVLAISFIFGGLSAQHIAILRRQMQFKKYAITRIFVAIVGPVTGILMAIMGAGYWSLVWMSVASSLCRTIAAWIACNWRPTRLKKSSDTMSFVRFGGNLTGARIFNVLSRKVDNILIGRYIGAESLGLYAKAYRMLMMPIEQIRSPLMAVALPALCSVQSDMKFFLEYLRKLIFLVAFLSMPLIGFAFVSADLLIPTLFGEKWVGIIPIFRAMAAAAFIQPSYGIIGVVFVALDRTRENLIKTVLHGSFVITAFIIGLQWGAYGVAVAYSIAIYIGLFPVLIYCFHDTPIRLTDFFSPLAKPALLSILVCIISYPIRLVTKGLHPMIQLPILLLIGCLLYFGGWFVTPRGRSKLMEILSYCRLILHREEDCGL